MTITPLDGASCLTGRVVATFARGRTLAQISWCAAQAGRTVPGRSWPARPKGELRYRLAIAGRHNVKNSLAAAACALAAGVPAITVARGLEAFVPVKGRCRAMQVRQGALDFTLVDDTYNANPDSMRAAIDVLADLPGAALVGDG